MHDDQYTDGHAVTFLGGGPAAPEDLRRAYALAPRIVAADGGAKHAAPLGLPVTDIVGDLDSLTNSEVWRKSGTRVTQLDEQESTDFEKCLYTIGTELAIGVGFLGRRLDHTLACLRTLIAYGERAVVLMGEGDVVFHAGRRFAIDAAPGERVSLFPMRAVRGRASEGLKWPIGGLNFAPDGVIGTSNLATGGAVVLEFDGPGMLVMLSKDRLEDVAAALLAQPR